MFVLLHWKLWANLIFAAAVMSVCLSVCQSVTFVDPVETNEDIFNFFHHRVATPF